MSPHFRLTARTFSLVSRIDQALGRLRGLAVTQPQPLLRKRNRVRSVQASAAIEGNPLSAAQVMALLDGQRVVGREKDLREILNVNDAYERLDGWVATSRKSLLQAHGTLVAVGARRDDRALLNRGGRAAEEVLRRRRGHHPIGGVSLVQTSHTWVPVSAPAGVMVKSLKPKRNRAELCSSCHDSSAAEAHFFVQTNNGSESCGVCHGKDKKYAVKVAHKVR